MLDISIKLINIIFLIHISSMESPEKFKSAIKDLKILWTASFLIWHMFACNPKEMENNRVADPSHRSTNDKKINRAIIPKIDKDTVSPATKKEHHNDDTDYKIKKVPLFMVMWYDSYKEDNTIVINDHANNISFTIPKTKYDTAHSIISEEISKITKNTKGARDRARKLINSKLLEISQDQDKLLTNN